MDFFESKLRTIETERAEIMAKEQTLREALSQLSKEKELLETDMTEKLDSLRKDTLRQ